MNKTFHALHHPSEKHYHRLAQRYPDNPFYTAAYATARAASGGDPWILSVHDGEELVGGCAALMIRGRLGRTVSILSAPPMNEPDVFWEGLVQFCRCNSVIGLDVHTYNSRPSQLPLLGRERWRKQRTEYVLELQGGDLRAGLSSNHKRNIKSGEKAGIMTRRSRDAQACQAHGDMIAASTYRRRGVRNSHLSSGELRKMHAYIEYGAGELFQAVLDGQVISSILVLKAASAGYYHSAGTSPKGMTVGASQYLIHRLSETLREEGLARFNLGGADADQSGLIRFKEGFGPTQIELESAGFAVGGRVRAKLFETAGHLQAHARRFLGIGSA